MIKDQPIQQFLDELASKAATPGGGSAAGVMGATSAALVSMVCNLTVGKEKYADVEPQMQAALERAEALRETLTDSIRQDVESFDKLMATYGLPKDTDEQKAARSEAIQAALKVATDVPLACARTCAEVIDVCRGVAEKGNKGVISDAGVAVLAAYAALRSAALNVYINVGSIKDREFVDSRLGELEQLLAGAGDETEAIYSIVRERL